MAWLMIRRCSVVLPAYFLPMGEVERSAAEAGGPGLLHAGVHVAFVIENHPGDVEVFPQGMVEGAVADVVDGAVPGEDDDLGEDVCSSRSDGPGPGLNLAPRAAAEAVPKP